MIFQIKATTHCAVTRPVVFDDVVVVVVVVLVLVLVLVLFVVIVLSFFLLFCPCDDNMLQTRGPGPDDRSSLLGWR